MSRRRARRQRQPGQHGGKQAYATEAEARDDLDTLAAKGRWGMGVYPCGTHWHIGHPPAWRRKESA